MRLDLIKNNYVHVPNFITKEQASYLRNEYKKYCSTISKTGDSQIDNVYVSYNFVLFSRLLVEKIFDVESILEEKVMPTYAYARIYERGNVLKRHTDREACEISFTLNLSKTHDWPIWFQKPDKSEVSIELNPCDAVMYLGCAADHWREPFEGDECVQVFLHYVRLNGPNSWAFFDKFRDPPLAPEPAQLPVTIL